MRTIRTTIQVIVSYSFASILGIALIPFWLAFCRM